MINTHTHKRVEIDRWNTKYRPLPPSTRLGQVKTTQPTNLHTPQALNQSAHVSIAVCINETAPEKLLSSSYTWLIFVCVCMPGADTRSQLSISPSINAAQDNVVYPAYIDAVYPCFLCTFCGYTLIRGIFPWGNAVYPRIPRTTPLDISRYKSNGVNRSWYNSILVDTKRNWKNTVSKVETIE
jgi:hypothetical protein